MFAPGKAPGNRVEQRSEAAERGHEAAPDQTGKPVEAALPDRRQGARADPDRAQLGPEPRQLGQIRHLDQREAPRAERQVAGRRDGPRDALDQRDTGRVPAFAAQRDRPAGITGDGADHVEAYAGARRGRDATGDRFDRAAIGEPARRRRRQNGKAAGAGEDEDVPRLCRRVARADAGNEGRAIGEVDIVHAGGDRRIHHRIGLGAIGLERPGGVHHQGGADRGEGGGKIAAAVESQRFGARPAAERAAEGFGLCQRSAGNDQVETCLVGEQARQPTAESTVAAENEHAAAALGHARNRSSSPRSAR